jgi:choline-phosphate cytidylyltransferase
MRQLQQAKQAFPDTYLIVGVTGDKETHRRKGLTVLSAKERAESVRHCKWVDEVVEDCPWIISDAPAFMDKFQIDYVAHDDIPYGADDEEDIYAPIKRAGKFLVTQRTEGVSTTGIITKIVKDHEKYIARQLKRGTSRQELNVSWLKKNEIEFKHAFREVRDNIKTNWETTGQELSRELRTFWQPGGLSAGNSRPASRPTSRPTSPSGQSLRGVEGERRPPAGLVGSASHAADFAAGYTLGLIGGVRGWVSVFDN